MPQDIVIHHNDADGYCSAGLISLLNKEQGREQPIYAIATYNTKDHIIDIINDKLAQTADTVIDTLYVLDFSFSTETMVALTQRVKPKRIVYLDHHVTSVQAMAEFNELAQREHLAEECFVQNNNSECGASLTWKHVKYRCPELNGNKEIAYVVNMCKDYDLWIHSYHDSLPFVTGVSITMHHPEQWRKLLCSKNLYKKYIQRGTGVIRQQKELAKKILRKPEKWEVMYFKGSKTIILNTNPQWVNIVSHELLDKSDLEAVLCYSISGLSNVYISMRSKGDFDAAAFMKKWFNGGGHKHAAGGYADDFNDLCKKLIFASSWSELAQNIAKE